MNVRLSPGRVAVWLVWIIFALLCAHVLSLLVRFELGRPGQMGLARMLDFNGEGNAPAWYSATALLGCALLLAVIWGVVRDAREPYAKHWGGLALILFLAAFDEAASVHELFNGPLRTLLETRGALRGPWVLPYGLALAIFAVAYLRFLFALPRRTARLFVTSGVLYVGGALGMEVLGGHFVDRIGLDSYGWSLTLVVEETLEMLGVAAFIYALLDYLARRGARLTVEFAKAGP